MPKFEEIPDIHIPGLTSSLTLALVWYCSYLRMSELNINPVPWEDVGLSDSGGDGCLWLGSAGAATGLHRDTYGWNCVCQIHGRKLWKLAPENSGTDNIHRKSNCQF